MAEPKLFDLPSNTNTLLEDSARVLREAIATHQPTHIVSMVSGGSDSAVSHRVAEELGVKIDLIIHGKTNTGIQETTDFVTDYYGNLGPNFTVADAGDVFEARVMRKGFYGIGPQAHVHAYHELKATPFRKAVSREIRKGKRGVRVLLLNGARKYESENRRINLPETRADGNNVWVNLIHSWRDQDTTEYLAERQVPRNPVSVQLCRSGECFCGSQQTKGDYNEAALLYPRWAERMNAIRAAAKAKHGFDWGEPCPKPADPNQLHLFGGFLPLCAECEPTAQAVEEAHTALAQQRG